MNPMLEALTPPQLVKLIRGSQRALRDKKRPLTPKKAQATQNQLVEAQAELRKRLEHLVSEAGREDHKAWRAFVGLPVRIGGITEMGEISPEYSPGTSIAVCFTGVSLDCPEYPEIHYYSPKDLTPKVRQSLWEFR